MPFGKDWTIEKRPNLLGGIRARLVMRAYKKANAKVQRLGREMTTLEDELDTLVNPASRNMTKGDLHILARRLNRINARYAKLGKSWKKALEAQSAAYEAIQRLLHDFGFRLLEQDQEPFVDPCDMSGTHGRDEYRSHNQNDQHE